MIASEMHVNPNVTTMQINQWPLLEMQDSRWKLENNCIYIFEVKRVIALT